MTALAAPTRAALPSYLREVWRHRDFATNMAMGNIAAQNAPTRLGPLWWVVNPVIMTSIYFIVFGLILGGARGDPKFLSYLVGGILVFRMTSQVMTDGTSAVLNNSKLITNIAFPRLLLPIAAVLENLLGFVTSLFAVYAILIPTAHLQIHRGMLLFPVVLLLHIMFTLGVATLSARFAVQHRDIKNLIPHLSRIWLYLSPILWQMDRVSNAPTIVIRMLQANPLYAFLGLYRTVTLNYPFNPLHLYLAIFWALLLLVVGVLVYWKFDRRMARYL